MENQITVKSNEDNNLKDLSPEMQEQLKKKCKEDQFTESAQGEQLEYFTE